MKEITILALHDGVGGVEKYIDTLCDMLGSDFNIDIIFTYKSPNKKYKFRNANIKYLINDISNRDKIKESLRKFQILKFVCEFVKALKILFLKHYLNIRAIKAIKSDIVITTRIFHNTLVRKYVTGNVIKIATEHNYHNNDSAYINKLLKSIVGFNKFVLVSKELCEFYKDKTAVDCIYIPNTFDMVIKNKSLCNNYNLVSVGRFSIEKGFVDLIDVVSLIKKQLPNIKLYLIGDGDEKDNIIKRIKDLKMDNNVVLTGFLNSEEIKNKLVDSSIFLMTSYTESFGIVLLEAMEAGILPIIFDSATGGCEVLNYDSELIIKNRDFEEMANRVVGYLNDREKLNLKINNNFKILENYKEINVKKTWLDMLEKCGNDNEL